MKTLPSYIACGTELVPPARAPHIVYVKTLYRIAGQGYAATTRLEGRRCTTNWC